MTRATPLAGAPDALAAGGSRGAARSPLRAAATVAAAVALLALAACSTTPPAGGGRAARAGADGPPDLPPSSLSEIPDATPRVEPIRLGGPNKPYEVAGQTYVPLTTDAPVVERGVASWYGRLFHGRRTASGETYNMNAMTAAHKTMPIPSFARVRNPANGREVVVRINDRGPFVKGRIIDLSYAAAVKLGVHNGVAPVEVSRLTHDEIRAGVGAPPADTRVAAAPLPARASPPAAVPLPSPVPTTAPPLVALPAPPVPLAAPAPPLAAETAAAMPVASSGGPASATSLAAAALASPMAPTPTAAVASPAAPPPEKARALTTAATGFWLQLGAFAKWDGATSFQHRVAQELDWLSPLLAVFAEGGMHRLQAGPYPTRELAREAADRVRSALQLVPVLVERR